MTPQADRSKAYPRGTYAKVARRLDVAPESVRDVALGYKTSGRIQRELDREWRKAQRKSAKQETAA